MAVTLTSRTSRNGLITLGISQSPAGSDDLVAAPAAGQKIVVTGFYLTGDVAGTLQIKDGTTSVLGTLNVPATGAVAWNGDLQSPILELTAATKLAITSATCAINGFLVYRVVNTP